jgi:hypothetical protein
MFSKSVLLTVVVVCMRARVDGVVRSSTKLYGLTSKESVLLTVTVVRTSDLKVELIVVA